MNVAQNSEGQGQRIRARHSHLALLALLVIFTSVTLMYGQLNPLGEAPDEIAHMDLIRFIGDQGHLPRNDAERQVAGYAYASLTGRHGHLTRLTVHPGTQGQRIGIRLLAEAVGFFQRERVYGITLNTQQSNTRARRLYEWFGFIALGKEAEVWVYGL